MKKIRGLIRSDSFKKISTVIGIIGVIIGVILGSYQISQEILKAKEIQKEVQIQLSIGDSFSERREYTRAIEEYEKALSFDKDNIEAHHRVITASRKKFELQLFEGYKVDSQEVDNTLARIYRVYALNSSSKEDIGLLLEEALIGKADGRLEASILVLEKAHNLCPKNPDVLSELGYLSSSKENIEALDLIRRAIEIQPSKPHYHYYLAEAAENAAFYAEAIREYDQTAMLSSENSQLTVVKEPYGLYLPSPGAMWAIDNDGLRSTSFLRLQGIFLEHGLNEESLLNSELDMPLNERVHILEYCHEKGYISYLKSFSYLKSYLYLARTYYELGDLKKAIATMRSGVDDFPGGWNDNDFLMSYISYAMFLEEGNLDPSTIREVHNKIENLDYDEAIFLSGSDFPWKHAGNYFIKNFTKGPKGNIIVKAGIQNVATNSGK